MNYIFPNIHSPFFKIAILVVLLFFPFSLLFSENANPVLPDYSVPENLPKTKNKQANKSPSKKKNHSKNKKSTKKTITGKKQKKKKPASFLFSDFALGISLYSPYGLAFRYKVLKNKSIDIAAGLDQNKKVPNVSLLYHFHNFSLLQFLNFSGIHFDLFYGGGFRFIAAKQKNIAFCFSGGLAFFIWHDKLEIFTSILPIVLPMLPAPDLKWEWSAGFRYNF